MKDEKKAQTKTSKDPQSQKQDDSNNASQTPLRSPGSGSRRGMPFKPALPTMSATPDLGQDDDDDDKSMKIPEGL